MERDFLGLNNRQPLRKVKREVHFDGFCELGFSKSSAVEWANFYGPPNFTSARELHESRAFPAASVLQRSHFGGLNQNASGAMNAKPLLLGGVPMTSPSPLLPTLNSFAGFADPRNNVASSAPQLTVIYAGTVNVFNDISQEKAQAIMLWAGNGLSMSSIMENPKGQAGDIISKPLGESERRAYGKHVLNASPNAATAAAAAAVSVSSSSGTQSADSVSISIDKPVAVKAINVMGSFCAAASMIPSVPQARKASLARFLEKRKERLMNAMPYSMSKMKLVECSTGESSGMNYSATSAA